MTPTPPPAWAMQKAREIVAADIPVWHKAAVLSGSRETWCSQELLARALAAERAETEARVEAETRERCVETLNDQISYCRFRAQEKHKAGNKKSEDMFTLVANTLSYQVTAIRRLPAKYQGDSHE